MLAANDDVNTSSGYKETRMQPALSLNLSQKVAMTPQLAESIRFLQLSAEELAEELKAALEDNVMLERDDEVVEEAVVTLESQAPIKEHRASGSGEDVGNFEDRLVEVEQTVHMRILQQAQMLYPDEHRLRIASAIIDATSDSGYLMVSVQAIARELRSIEPVLASEVEAVLFSMQRMEPVGFAARSLQECLRIQLEELAEHTPGRGLAFQIVDHHLDALGRMALQEMSASLACDEAQIAQAVRLIRSLSPKPAAQEQLAVAVIPDVSVEVGERGWAVRLNNSIIPGVHINPEYERVVSEDSQAKALRAQLQEARWLLRSVEMRNDTLLRATQYIFECQKDFLCRGSIALRPLTLKQVADAIGVHESTISRITTSKYVQTPHGVFSLKTFFPSQLVTAEGVAASGAAVKAMIQKLVANEEPAQPLRDVDLAAILARRGVKIARRTIAKYREALGIASSKERQETYRIQSVMQRRLHHGPEARLAS